MTYTSEVKCFLSFSFWELGQDKHWTFIQQLHRKTVKLELSLCIFEICHFHMNNFKNIIWHILNKMRFSGLKYWIKFSLKLIIVFLYISSCQSHILKLTNWSRYCPLNYISAHLGVHFFSKTVFHLQNIFFSFYTLWMFSQFEYRIFWLFHVTMCLKLIEIPNYDRVT